MSIQVANISLVGAIVGTAGKINFGQAIPPPTIGEQMRPQSATEYKLVIQNESGCGLTCLFPLTRKSVSIRAGDGRIIGIPPGEQELDFVVGYVLPNAPVAQLLADLYIPGEEIDAIGTLGNSPIGLSGGVVTGLATKIPIDTTGGDIVGIEFGPDAHSTSDWEFVCAANGAFYLRDSKNARNVWLAQFTDGQLLAIIGMRTPLVGITGGPADATIDWESNLIVFRTPETGITAQGYVFQVYDGAAGQNPLQIGQNGATGATAISATGTITKIGGQATAGSFGVPVIVAVSAVSVVAATTLQTILTFTIPANGRYRLSPFLNIGNGTAANKPNFRCTYTNGAGNADQSNFYAEDLSGSGNLRALNAGNVTLPAAGGVAYDMSIGPLVLELNTGTLTVTYQTNGTPNDRVSVIVERLA